MSDRLAEIEDVRAFLKTSWEIHSNPTYIAEGQARAATFEALVEIARAAQAADDLLAGMWSFNDEARANLGNTWFVQASDVLRAALAAVSGRDET